MTCWLPLTTAQGRLGVLSFGSRSGTPYSREALAFMEQIAASVVVAVGSAINREQAQSLELELREERDRLRFILDLNNLLVSQLDYRELLEAISDTVQRVVEADHVGVALYDPEARELCADVIYDRAGPDDGDSRTPGEIEYVRGLGVWCRCRIDHTYTKPRTNLPNA